MRIKIERISQLKDPRSYTTTYYITTTNGYDQEPCHNQSSEPETDIAEPELEREAERWCMLGDNDRLEPLALYLAILSSADLSSMIT